MLLPRLAAFLMALMVGCSGAPRIVRTAAGEGGTLVVHIPRAAEDPPVKLAPAEFAPAFRTMARQVRLLGTPRETVSRTFQLDALNLDQLSGEFLYLPRDRKLVPLGEETLEGALTEAEEKLASDYKGWCARAHGLEADCLGGALVGGRYLDLQGRYVLALALSRSPVIPEMQAALGRMVSIQEVIGAALWMMMTVLVLLAMPEPVSKGIAASLAVVLALWVGVETLYNLQGHRGPHPEAYHQIVYDRLRKALGNCSTVVDCRANLTRELRALSQEIATPGTELNQLIARGKVR